MRRAAVAGICTALTLAACQSVAPTKAPPAISAATDVNISPTHAYVAPKAPPAPAPPREEARLTPPPPPPPPPPALAELNGGGTDRLEDWLGTPNLKRHDEPAEIWRYDGADCALYVFLYRDGAKAPLHVAHVSALPRRGDAGAPQDAQHCFEALWQVRHGAPTKPTS